MDRSWNVSLPADPVEANVVPTGAGPSGASSESILNPSLPARSPDHTRWFRRSAITSYTTSGGAFVVTDGCVRNPNGLVAMADAPRSTQPKTWISRQETQDGLAAVSTRTNRATT